MRAATLRTALAAALLAPAGVAHAASVTLAEATAGAASAFALLAAIAAVACFLARHRLARRLAAAESDRAALTALLATAPAGALALAGDGTLLRASPPLARLLGLEAGAPVGRKAA